MAVKYSKLMRTVSERYQRPLEKMLPEMMNEKGLSGTADELGISNATLAYWMLKLGLNTRRVTLAQGESLEIKRTEGR